MTSYSLSSYFAHHLIHAQPPFRFFFSKAKSQTLTSTEVLHAARNYYELKHPNTEEPSHPAANSHNTEDCRVRIGMQKRGVAPVTSKARVAIASSEGGRTPSRTIATAYVSRSAPYQVFFFDSAASDHMVSNLSILAHPKPHSSPVVKGDKSELRGTQRDPSRLPTSSPCTMSFAYPIYAAI